MITQVTDTPFGLSFWENYIYKKEIHIRDMEIFLYLMAILISLRTWSITTNAAMIQLYNISCGGAHQS